MIIKNFVSFEGQHCETTAAGCLLKNLGIELSEPMLFGLGEGLGFIFWNMKHMDFPFIGGRNKPDLLSLNLAANLQLELEAKETSSIKKAWQNVMEEIDRGVPVGLKLDCYHLEYFTDKIHFAGHYTAMYGYDDTYAYLVDTNQQGRMTKTSLHSLELARNEKGPMSSKNRSYTIKRTGKDYDPIKAVKSAIRNNAAEYLNPPISNIGYKGIAKSSKAVKKWFKTSPDVSRDFKTTAMMMERAGTGGAIFRNLYRDFLKESADLLESEQVRKAYEEFSHIAALWSEVASLFDKTGDTGNEIYINQASDILADLSEREKRVMEALETL